jgi:hypothetical protein
MQLGWIDRHEQDARASSGEQDAGIYLKVFYYIWLSSNSGDMMQLGWINRHEQDARASRGKK